MNIKFKTGDRVFCNAAKRRSTSPKNGTFGTIIRRSIHAGWLVEWDDYYDALTWTALMGTGEIEHLDNYNEVDKSNW